MKKHVLAVSIAAVLGAGAAGTAFAAASLNNEQGFGHTNIIPYFSTQGDNVTHIHITNTDTANAKAVKVRFRGAEWSDDLFDFTLFLSPGDVFAAEVSSNADGKSQFRAFDNSCTLPTAVNNGEYHEFGTWRLSGERASGTREGYVEVISMADIPSGSTLFTAIKHVNGVAPCTATVLNALVADNPWTTTSNAAMAAPTGGLTSWARVLDIVGIKAYGYEATSIAYSAPQKIYFKQSNDALTPSLSFTTDMIFFDATTVAGTASSTTADVLEVMYQFDMPDLSTPAEAASANAAAHLAAVVPLLQKSAVETDYATNPDVGGATDIVLNQPLRRYFYTYQAGTGTTEGTDYARTIGSDKFNVTGMSASIYQDFTGATAKANRIVLANLGNTFKPSATYSGAYVIFDRNEQFAEPSSGIVISPQPPTTIEQVAIAGEVSVISLNNNGATTTGALGGQLTINDIDGDYKNGWMALSTITSPNNQQLPIIGFSAMKVTGNQNYGTTLKLNYK